MGVLERNTRCGISSALRFWYSTNSTRRPSSWMELSKASNWRSFADLAGRDLGGDCGWQYLDVQFPRLARRIGVGRASR